MSFVSRCVGVTFALLRTCTQHNDVEKRDSVRKNSIGPPTTTGVEQNKSRVNYERRYSRHRLWCGRQTGDACDKTATAGAYTDRHDVGLLDMSACTCQVEFSIRPVQLKSSEMIRFYSAVLRRYTRLTEKCQLGLERNIAAIISWSS